MRFFSRKSLFTLFLFLIPLLPLYAKDDLSRRHAIVEQNAEILSSLTEGLSPSDTIRFDDMLFTVEQAWDFWCSTEGLDNVQPQGVVASGVKKWSNNTVRYYFDSGITSSRKSLFRNSIANWIDEKTSGLNFVELNGPSGNCVRVFSDESEEASYSYVGMIGGVQDLHIMDEQWDAHTIAHEWGHTLGLWHEQQRSDRDNYIQFLPEQSLINAGYKNVLPLTIDDENYRSAFGLINPGITYGDYDYKSIMHYGYGPEPVRYSDGNYYFIQSVRGFCFGFCTINPRISIRYGISNYYPSANDTEAVRRLYGLSGIPKITLKDAVDASSLTWTSGGDAIWRGEATTVNNGGDVAQSGRVDHYQETWIQTTVSGTGILSFIWKVSSEYKYDNLEFYIDGVQKDRISGEINWKKNLYRERFGKSFASMEIQEG